VSANCQTVYPSAQTQVGGVHGPIELAEGRNQQVNRSALVNPLLKVMVKGTVRLVPDPVAAAVLPPDSVHGLSLTLAPPPSPSAALAVSLNRNNWLFPGI
jgi:hypothetical protein